MKCDRCDKAKACCGPAAVAALVLCDPCSEVMKVASKDVVSKVVFDAKARDNLRKIEQFLWPH